MLAGLSAAGCATSPEPSDTEAPGEAMTEPAALDAGYVRVPHGLVHPDCVYVIDDGDSVDADGSIVSALGVRSEIAPCEHVAGPLAQQASIDAIDAASVVAGTGGWIEDAERTNPKGIKSMTATWVVPPAPVGRHGQTVFFFPALEPTSGAKIVQPVLQWGTSKAGGGAYWGISSWTGPINGNYYTSTLRQTSAGHKIIGSMQGSSCSGDVCGAWTVTTDDATACISTTLKTTGNGAVFNWVFGGVLEAYNITGCPDYPNNTSTTFTSVYAYNMAGALTAGAWLKPITHTGCGQAVGTGSYDVKLSY
jgi:hypothetical protein